MENDKKVSIIIPVYNGEKYLERCLNSVVNQTMESIEIVVINDGSTDKTQEIIDKYASSNDNIIKLYQKNSGQGIARNNALDIVGGEYIMFIDSDDYIKKDAVETLYREASKEKFDLVIYNWIKVDQVGNHLEKNDHSDFDDVILNRNDLILHFLTNNQQLIEGFSWNKFIKRSIFEQSHIRYPSMKFEDIPTIFQVLAKIDKCKYINKYLYYYVSHSESTVHTLSESTLKDFLNSIIMVKDYLIDNGLFSRFEDDYFAYKCNQLLREYGRSLEVIKSYPNLYSLYQKHLNEITLKDCFRTSNYRDIKLVLKLICYKLGLLHLLIVVYHKIKPVH